jgi:hypothetical protein
MLAQERCVVGGVGAKIAEQTAPCEPYRPEGFDPNSLPRLHPSLSSYVQFAGACQNAAKKTGKSRFQIFSPQPVHKNCSLALRCNHTVLAQNSKMMRKGGFGRVDTEPAAGFLANFVELAHDFQTHWIGKCLKHGS